MDFTDMPVHHRAQLESAMRRIGYRLVDLCTKLNVEHHFEPSTGTFYFDNKCIYGNNKLNGKSFIKPIYENIYKEKLLI